MKLPYPILLCLIFFSLQITAGAVVRSWENKEGVQIRAELIRIEDGYALLRVDGWTHRVAIAELSQSDQDFLTNWQESRARGGSLTETRDIGAGRDFSRPERGTKKGIGIAPARHPDWRERLQTLNLSWYYTWTARQPFESPEGIEFIPMIFGRANQVEVAVGFVKGVKEERGHRYLMGHNEPDSARQANRTVEEVLDDWPLLESVGLPLISPAAIHPDREWMIAFMQGVEERGLRVDFIAVHSYGGPDPNGFLNRLERIYQRYGRPIWITEFAVGDWSAETVAENRHSPEVILNFMRRVLPELERRDYIYRYAWYSTYPDHPNLGTSALFNADGTLTPLGEFYSRHR